MAGHHQKVEDLEQILSQSPQEEPTPLKPKFPTPAPRSGRQSISVV